MRNKLLIGGAVGLLAAMVIGIAAMILDVIIEAISVG